MEYSRCQTPRYCRILDGIEARGNGMFEAGLQHVRADFHLHTVKDKEFRYPGASDTFIKDYVSALKRAGIGVGVITNHNKFDQDEFKALRKAARKQDILLLPGVELTVKEGANGVHTLIVFNPEEWLENNSIQRFLTASFDVVLSPEDSNEKSSNDLKNTFARLDQSGFDYFVVFAHVDQDCGLFHECNVGLLRALSRIPSFKEHVLALQKATKNTHLNQFQEYFDYLPAVVEGSDPKSIDDIGKGKRSTYIKIGELSYAAVKFALLDYKDRVSETIPENKHGFIKSVSFQGGKFDGQTIQFSSALNTLIGIRGSGKSSVLEAIRYVFGFSAQMDKDYKDNLIKSILESGGKVTLKVANKHGKQYSLSRILGEKTTIQNERGQDLNIAPVSLFDGVQYFGQKELSGSTDHENVLLKKLFDGRINEPSDLEHIVNDLTESVEQLLALRKIPERINEIERSCAELEHKRSIYEEKGVADKLKKQSQYTKDATKLGIINEKIDIVLSEFQCVCAKNHSVSNILDGYSSKFNPNIFEKVSEILSQIDCQLSQIASCASKIEAQREKIDKLTCLLNEKIQKLSDEFAQIKREINNTSLDLDFYIKTTSDLQKFKESLRDLKNKLESKSILETAFLKAARERNELLKKVYCSYSSEVKAINESKSELRIEINFKGDKKGFKTQLKKYFKGSGLSDLKYQSLCDNFSDYVSIVEDWVVQDGQKLKTLLTLSEYTKFEEKLQDQYKDLLTMKVEDRVDIYYHNKLLRWHSIGQRASALLLFILTQDNNDIVIIDQPEDDLDNKVIYDEVIKLISKKKPFVQFIFATHNANIPVLGDSERVLALEFQEKKICVFQGNIDSSNTHKKIIDIMEGGQAAFDRRKRIYKS